MEQQNPWTAGAPASAPATSRSTSPGLVIGLVLGGVLLLLVVVAAGGIFAYNLYRAGTSSPSAQGDPDDIVLRQEPGTGPAMRYGDTPIYDACSLVTINGLGSLGVSLSPVRHLYAAPFGKVKDPCEIVSVEAYRAAYPSHTGAPSMVDASYPLDAPIPDNQSARRAELSCTRNNIVPRGALNKDEHRSLQVDLSVWTKEKAADLTNDANCAPSYKSRDHSEPVAITPPIGTRKSCLADYESDWLLKFQASTVSVTVADGGTEPKPDVSVRREQLVPAARQIASAGLFR